MKLGTFILAALCVASPVYADHLAMVEQYQRAYGQTPDPHLLTMIANEYRDAGKPVEALQYYCSYMFIAPDGDDADYASQQAHVLKPGAESDHDACVAQKPVTHNVDELNVLPVVPPRISKREVAGISVIALGLGAFGLALYEGKQGDKLQAQLYGLDPELPKPSWYDATKSQATTFYNRQKWALAGGGALIVTGGILYLIGRHDRLKAEATLVAPSITRSGAGLTMSGKF
jgi:hypothetical protein